LPCWSREGNLSYSYVMAGGTPCPAIISIKGEGTLDQLQLQTYFSRVISSGLLTKPGEDNLTAH